MACKPHVCHYHPKDTGWYYLQSRYYDPIVKRFLNADSFASTGQGFLGNNMFSYCENNAICFYDNSGHYRTWAIRETDGPNNAKYRMEDDDGYNNLSHTNAPNYVSSFCKSGCSHTLGLFGLKDSSFKYSARGVASVPYGANTASAKFLFPTDLIWKEIDKINYSKITVNGRSFSLKKGKVTVYLLYEFSIIRMDITIMSITTEEEVLEGLYNELNGMAGESNINNGGGGPGGSCLQIE